MSDEVKIIKFDPLDQIRLLNDNSQENIANARLNQCAGPACSVFLGDKLVACGGVRIYGIGEAWLLCSEIAKQYPKELLKQTQLWLEMAIRDKSLWRVYAEAHDETSIKFLEHLDFKQVTAFIIR